jgi:hypothetical protein
MHNISNNTCIYGIDSQINLKDELEEQCRNTSKQQNALIHNVYNINNRHFWRTNFEQAIQHLDDHQYVILIKHFEIEKGDGSKNDLIIYYY